MERRTFIRRSLAGAIGLCGIALPVFAKTETEQPRRSFLGQRSQLRADSGQRSFKVGDRVQLKSGGAIMRVTEPESNGNVTVAWTDLDGDFNKESIEPICLRLIA